MLNYQFFVLLNTKNILHTVFGTFGIITLITFRTRGTERSLILANNNINNNYL